MATFPSGLAFLIFGSCVAHGKVKKVFGLMKSHPAALDVAARWAEAQAKRKDKQELSDFVGFKPDKSSAPVVAADPSVNKGVKGTKRTGSDALETPSAKAPPQAATRKAAKLALARPELQMRAAPAESEEKPTEKNCQASAAASKATDSTAEVANGSQALQAQTEPPENEQGLTEKEQKEWSSFCKKMGPSWQKRFAGQMAQRLATSRGKENRQKKKEKKEKKDKQERKDKKHKDKKEKKEGKEKTHKEKKSKKRAVEDDDDEDCNKQKKQRPEKKARAKAEPQAKASAKAEPKGKAKPKAKAGPKAEAKAAPKAKESAAGLAAKLTAK